jgi:nucleotide-binding universal stress UspA family protein
MAKGEGTQITVLSSDETAKRYAPGVGEIHEEAQIECEMCIEKVRQAQAMAQEQGVLVKTVCTEGSAADAILNYAKNNDVDLIAIGRSGRSGLLGALIGNTAAHITEHAPCDVLVVCCN